MQKIYKLKDVADKAGVSPSTVSRILAGKIMGVKVPDETRARILNAAKELNYSPNVNASSLVKGSSNTIALVLPSSIDSSGRIFSDSFLNLLLMGIEEVMMTRRCRLLLEFRHETFVSAREHLKIFNDGSVGSMLIWGATASDSYVEDLYGMPALQVGSRYKDDARMNYIGHDIAHGSRLVAEKLLKSGKRRIACVWGPCYSSISEDNRQGVLEAMREYGVDPLLEARAKSFQREAYEKSVGEIFDSPLLPEAVLLPTNAMALVAYEAAMKRGLRVPEDISIGGGLGGERDIPWLVSYAIDYFGIGRRAASAALDLAGGKLKTPYKELLPVELIVNGKPA